MRFELVVARSPALVPFATRLLLLVLRDPGVVAIVVCVVSFTVG